MFARLAIPERTHLNLHGGLGTPRRRHCQFAQGSGQILQASFFDASIVPGWGLTFTGLFETNDLGEISPSGGGRASSPVTSD